MNNGTRFLKILLAVPLALIVAGYAAVVAQDLLDDDYYKTVPRVLVDASRDGGAWWYPQSENFDPTLYHQGTALANYLRSQEMLVDERPRPYPISDELLQQYELVIRVGMYSLTGYTGSEVAAYADYVANGGYLVLLSDHTTGFNGAPDMLAHHFGLYMSGGEFGHIEEFAEHPITEGLSSLLYNFGSVLTEAPPPSAIELGFLDDQTVMGIMPYGFGQVFFMGDIHAIVFAQQPFTENVMTYFLTVEGLALQVLYADLDAGAEAGLLNKLTSAYEAFDSGRLIPFENKVEAFINQVEALLQAGRINPSTADSLIGAALSLIRSEPADEPVADSCPCWSEDQLAKLPVPGEEAYCNAEEDQLIIWQTGCEHDFRVNIGEWGYQCTMNQACYAPYKVDQEGISEAELAICASHIQDRCKQLKMKMPGWP